MDGRDPRSARSTRPPIRSGNAAADGRSAPIAALDALLRSILNDGRRTAYRHAAHYLVRMRRLAPGCGLVEAHAALEAELAKAHRIKKAFWQEVEWEEE